MVNHKIFLGFVFSVLLLASLVLAGALGFIIGLAFLAVIFGPGGGVSIPDTDSFGKIFASCIVYCWNAIGDCVEDKAIGSNMEQNKGWFFRVLNEQANSKQSFSIKITKGIFGILIALAYLGGGGFAGYLLINALMSETLALNLGLFLSLGTTVGLGFGILLMIAEVYKIVKSVQKYLIHKEAEVKFDQMVKDDTISNFIEQKRQIKTI